MRTLAATLLVILSLGSIPTTSLMAPALAADTPPSPGPSTVKAIVQAKTPPGQLTAKFAVGERKVTVDDAAARERLAQALPNDVVEVEVDQIDNPQHIKKLITLSRPVGEGSRFWVLLIGFAIVFGVAGLFTRGSPRGFLLGADGRYSNSKCQLALWFGVVMMVYLATVMLRVCVWGWDFLYGVEIPSNLLALTGLSALSFGGAKAITATKVDNISKTVAAKAEDVAKAQQQLNAAGAAQAAAPLALVAVHDQAVQAATRAVASAAAEADAAANPKPQAAAPNIVRDLIQNDKGDPDIGDFQMIFITLLAAITFVIAGFNFLGAIEQSAHIKLPDVDTTLLSGFGIGQGAYLIKKMAAPLGQG